MNYEDERLRVKYLPASGEDGGKHGLVVAFSGVGLSLGGMQPDEFAGTASQAGGRNHVLFVTDKLRSWFSAPGLMDQITAHVREAAEHVGVSTVSTIGNSMGAYGAVRLSREFPVATVVAFSPQYSMNPDIVAETRWQEHRPAIDLSRHLPLKDCMAPPTRYNLVFGGLGRSEIRHRDLFPVFPGVRLLTLPGAGHNVVQKIKEFGLLSSLVSAFFAQDDARVDEIADAYRQALEAAEPNGRP